MIRGTTPIITFRMPEAYNIDSIEVSFLQCGVVLFTKGNEEVEIEGNIIQLKLTEAETLLFSASKQVYIQVRVAIGDNRLASQIFKVRVSDVLKNGELQQDE